MTDLLSKEVLRLPMRVAGKFRERWIGSIAALIHEGHVTRFKTICAGIVRFSAYVVVPMSHGLDLDKLLSILEQSRQT